MGITTFALQTALSLLLTEEESPDTIGKHSG